MNIPYPAGPVVVPPDLSKPSPGYRRRARVAMVGLLLFIALYLGLLVWFAWNGWRLIRMDDLFAAALGVANWFFAIFLAKALIFFKRAKPPLAVEITERDEPRLFAFLNRLVAEVGAPAPHRVYLSHDVNAAVFFDLSLANLIYPSRKNLVIGVGLVNVLNLGEFKAVLAHEFGHFAQRSMAVGRWVYMARQVAQHIVGKRDVLDRILLGISHLDVRIAWIGWILRVVVWSLRSTLEIVFRLVVLAERALAREMEFQADLVAVSLSGSDALVNALHRLAAADETLGEATDVAAAQLRQGRCVRDIYELQTRALERLRAILDDESYGASPTLPNTGRERHRVFDSQTAQPPKMWATHPPNRAREDNAKRRYVACKIDPRPAWVLFEDPGATRRLLTRHLLKSTEIELAKLEQLDDEGGAAALDRRFERTYFDTRYRGAYLGRSCVREATQAAELFDLDGVTVDFARLYPESLRRELSRWKDTLVEQATLEGLRDGRLHAVDGVLRHRGRAIKSRELPAALEEVRADSGEARRRLAEHDRLCRTMHWHAARALDIDWANYHYSLVALLHYADHTEADLHDARGHLEHVMAIVTADDRVTDAERRQVVAACLDVHGALQAIHSQASEVVLPVELANTLGVLAWAQALGEPYSLPAPREDNIGDWLGVIDSWINAVLGPLDALERLALQTLLDTEAEIEACTREGRAPGPAPTPAAVPRQYRVIPPGKEREREAKLSLWDRFYLADGPVAATARTLIAASIVGAVLYGGFYRW